MVTRQFIRLPVTDVCSRAAVCASVGVGGRISPRVDGFKQEVASLPSPILKSIPGRSY